MSSRNLRVPSPAVEDAPPIGARDRRRLLADARQLLADRLSAVVHEGLEKMSEDLVAAALEKVRADEQQALLEAVSLVRMNRAQIEGRFRSEFLDVFERRLLPHVETPLPPSAPGELSLVDESVMTGEIELARLTRRTRNRLDPDEVLGMRARLAELVEREWFDETRHPASPEAIFEALQRVLDELDPAPTVRSALLEAFEPCLSSNLNHVYSTVNAQLRSNRVLPQIRPRVELPGRARRLQDAAMEAAADGVRPLPAKVSEAGSGPADTATAASTAGSVAGAGVVAGRPEDGLVGDGHADETADPFIQLARRLADGDTDARAPAARLLSDPDLFGMADLPVADVELPLLDALATVPIDGSSAPRAPGPVFAELGQHARSMGSPLDQLMVEIVALVFDYIYNDQRLDDAVKQQLLRLQVVAVKAALLDRSFFARRQHPMRRLIDAITDLATDPDADLAPDSPLLDGLAELIDWIIGNFDSDLGIFEDALRRLEVIEMAEADRRSARLCEITQQAEHEEALAQAQEMARQEIAARVDETVPGFVREFLDAWWADVLAFARVDGNDPDREYQRVLRLAEHLLWSVAPKGPEEITRLAALLPQLIGGLAAGLEVVDPPAPQRDRFFNQLLAWHTQAIAEAKLAGDALRARPRVPVRLLEDGQVEFRQKPAPTQPPPREEAAEVEASELDALSRRCLLDFDEGGETLRVRLAWISPSRRLFALSRYPDFARSLTREELAELMAEGRVRLVAEESPLDRAIESVMDENPPDPVD